jgi:hypothetical protein
MNHEIKPHVKWFSLGSLESTTIAFLGTRPCFLPEEGPTALVLTVMGNPFMISFFDA